jgi:hypothetical protein
MPPKSTHPPPLAKPLEPRIAQTRILSSYCVDTLCGKGSRHFSQALIANICALLRMKNRCVDLAPGILTQ